ncbi:hypothetical protein ACRALDRAFT_212261 [Sodiomyces alcalophilus JCM 7366]|uniref:uncharacterized protein n=1 Tax=Sodiomyces alcalophilus JCM 7366 TaxID=591952 RepID=UPI0039B4CC2B
MVCRLHLQLQLQLLLLDLNRGLLLLKSLRIRQDQTRPCFVAIVVRSDPLKRSRQSMSMRNEVEEEDTMRRGSCEEGGLSFEVAIYRRYEVLSTSYEVGTAERQVLPCALRFSVVCTELSHYLRHQDQITKQYRDSECFLASQKQSFNRLKAPPYLAETSYKRNITLLIAKYLI